MREEEVCVVILAAGNSSRLGRPKQSLIVEGESLLKNAVKAANSSKADGALVVLGYEPERFKKEIEEFEVPILVNTGWKKGMGSSLKLAMRHLVGNTAIGAVVISVCDQPYLESTVFDQLIDKWENNRTAVVASAYAETIGVPALFPRYLFNDLIKIQDRQGAKALLKRQRDIETVKFEKGWIDIDTPEDLDLI